jgi:DNA-binding NarL/FixJ family response regulator
MMSPAAAAEGETTPLAVRDALRVPLRTVIAEDDYLVREALDRLLATQPDVDVVAACAALPDLYAVVREHEPDVVLTDIRMPPTHTDEGILAARWLRENAPRTGVLVLSQHVEPEYAAALFEGGSQGRGYLLKERIGDVAELVAALHEVARGGSVVDPRVVDALLAGSRRSPLDALTDREREVLVELAKGRSNAAIGGALHLSQGAVEKHISAVFGKLGLPDEPGVHRRVQAVLVYLGELR